MPSSILKTSTILNNKSVKNLLLDSNIVIPYIDSNHAKHALVQSELDRLVALKIELFYVQPSLLEVIQYWRTKVLFHAVQAFVDSVGAENLPQELVDITERAARDFQQNSRREGKFFYEDDVKEIRKLIVQTGNIELWEQLSSTWNGDITKLPGKMKKLNLIYAQYGSSILPDADKANRPKWSDTLKLIEAFAISSNDAAILNMASYRSFYGFVSNDGDMHFAAKHGGLRTDLYTIF